MENDVVFLWERLILFFDIGFSDFEYYKIFYLENLNFCLRIFQGFIIVLWVKLGEEYNSKGLERIGFIDLIEMRDFGYMVLCRGVYYVCIVGWILWIGILG